MPRFILKQKYFAIRDGFYVKDESGRDCFYAKGRVFTLAKKLWLNDLNGREIFFIRQRLFRLFPRYDIVSGDHIEATVKRTFPLIFGKRYKVKSQNHGTMVVRGAVSFNFTVKRDGATVAKIHKKLLKIADTYNVDVNNPSESAFMVALALIIDARHHRKH